MKSTYPEDAEQGNVYMVNSKVLALSLLVSSILLSACDVPKVAEIDLIKSTRDLSKVQNAVSFLSRNPETTKFKNFKAAVVSKTDGTEQIVACGYILAENAFGGFNGYAPFIYESGASLGPLAIAGQTYSPLGFKVHITSEIVFQHCANYGISINSIDLD